MSDVLLGTVHLLLDQELYSDLKNNNKQKKK